MANLGEQMAAEVDSKVQKFRTLQEEIQKLRTDQQLLMQQLSENEMVKQELDLLDDSSQVYKMVGPVLMKNETDDAKQTVNQRLELISGELWVFHCITIKAFDPYAFSYIVIIFFSVFDLYRKKVEKSIKSKEEESQETAKKIQGE